MNDMKNYKRSILEAGEIFKAYGFEVVERIALKKIWTGKIYR